MLQTAGCVHPASLSFSASPLPLFILSNVNAENHLFDRHFCLKYSLRCVGRAKPGLESTNMAFTEGLQPTESSFVIKFKVLSSLE